MFVYGITDKGPVRGVNQDGIFAAGTIGTGNSSKINVTPEFPALIFVADGVGGTQDGSVAVNAAMAYAIQSSCPTDKDTLSKYLYDMNDYVCNAARYKNADTAATIAGILITDSQVLSFDIGDSKVFSINHGYLQQLSVDDTVFGLTDTDQPEQPTGKAPLLQYLGKANLETDGHITFASSSSEFLICSDGLTDMVELDDMEEIIGMYTAPIQMVHELYDKAANSGGHDNISIIYVKLDR